MSLPTYQQATKRPNVLCLAALSMEANTMVACCRVNKEVNDTIKHLIWRDPVNIVAAKVKPYSAMQKFVENAEYVRVQIRNLVALLDLSLLLSPDLIANYPIDYQLHEQDIQERWYRIPLSLFPNVRFILVDHAPTLYTFHPSNEALMALRDTPGPSQKMASSAPKYSDKTTLGYPRSRDLHPLLISAEYCQCLDTTSLSESTVPFLDSLMFLNISYTMITADWGRVFFQMRLFNLRILKLRGLRLTDAKLPSIIINSAYKLWSLDLSDNLLTDAVIDMLLGFSIANPMLLPKISPGAKWDRFYEETPHYEPREASEFRHENRPSTLSPLRGDSAYSFIDNLILHSDISSFDNDFIDSHAALVRPTGITHLYLSDNKITSRGITRLLKSTNRLQVLDIGKFKPTRSSGASQINIQVVTNTQPFQRCSGTRFESLRMHHSIVTRVPTSFSGDTTSAFNPALLYAAEKYSPKDDKDFHVFPAFSPNDNHRISNLTLTQIPTHSYGATLTRLRDFILDCAAQEYAIKTAQSSPTNRRAPQLLPGLRSLTLEFIPPAQEETSMFTGGSVSGDRDADEFLAQSMGDFSFFDDAGPTASISRRVSNVSANLSERLARVGSSGSLTSNRRKKSDGANEESGGPGDLVDVVQELRNFRKQQGRLWRGRLKLVIPREEYAFPD